MKDLRGTTAIVTGASRRIGVYTARALGVQAIAAVCDVAQPDDRANLLARTEAELGPVDVPRQANTDSSASPTHREPSTTAPPSDSPS